MNILVTGGTGGLGRAIVEIMAQDSANTVYFTYCTAEDKAKEIMAIYANAVGVKCNQTQASDMAALCTAIEEWNLDALVNNAWTGRSENIRFHKLNVNDLSDGFVRNVLPVMQLTQTALATFRKKKDGRIVTILTSALVGDLPLGYGLYSAEKAYVAQMAKVWAREYVKMGIVSNCISPDFMETDFTSSLDERLVAQMRDLHPLKTLLTPAAVAQMVAVLLHAPKHVNGVNIPINAGTSI